MLQAIETPTIIVAPPPPASPNSCDPQPYRWNDLCGPAASPTRHLDIGSDVWLTIGGEVRVRTETIDHPDLGLRSAAGYATADVRGLLEGDVRTTAGPRIFVQLSVAGEQGREPASRPFDRSLPDVAQAFIDLPLDVRGTTFTLRIGRQELDLGANRLVSNREAANLRRAFDMATVIVDRGRTRLTVFTGRPVQNQAGAFEDRADPGERFEGANLHVQPTSTLSAEFFAFRRRRDRAVYAAGVGSESRATFGSRFAFRNRQWDGATQFAYQSGVFADERISAVGVSFEGGRRWSSVPLAPRLGMIVGYASGDRRAGDGRLGTFDPVYPNLSYFSDAPVFYPGNTWDVQPTVSLAPAHRIIVTFGVDFVQRLHAADAIYGPPGIPLSPPRVDAAGHAVTLASAKLAWRPDAHLSADVSFVRGLAGSSLASATVRNFSYAIVETAYKF